MIIEVPIRLQLVGKRFQPQSVVIIEVPIRLQLVGKRFQPHRDPIFPLSWARYQNKNPCTYAEVIF